MDTEAENTLKLLEALNRGHIKEIYKLMEANVTPEDRKACEQNEMDKDTLKEAIQKKAYEYLETPLVILDDMDFQSDDEKYIFLEKELKKSIVTRGCSPEIQHALVGVCLERCMLEHARMLAERDLGL